MVEFVVPPHLRPRHKTFVPADGSLKNVAFMRHVNALVPCFLQNTEYSPLQPSAMFRPALRDWCGVLTLPLLAAADITLEPCVPDSEATHLSSKPVSIIPILYSSLLDSLIKQIIEHLPSRIRVFLSRLCPLGCSVLEFVPPFLLSSHSVRPGRLRLFELTWLD